MIALQGFAWFAREPQLIGGAEGARIRTEISRLTQPALDLPSQKAAKVVKIRALTHRSTPGSGIFASCPFLSAV
jgi:hypothetical protein